MRKLDFFENLSANRNFEGSFLLNFYFYQLQKGWECVLQSEDQSRGIITCQRNPEGEKHLVCPKFLITSDFKSPRGKLKFTTPHRTFLKILEVFPSVEQGFIS